MAPPTKLGPLNEKEKAEFDNIRYDDIRECMDIKKLMRLEAYMRAENFSTTADHAEARLRELGQRAANDETDAQLARQLAEERARASVEIAAWTAKQKEMDASLGAVGRERPSSVSGVAFPPVRNPQRPGDAAAPPPAAKPQQPPSSSASTAKTDSAVGTAVRSGREYYDRWEKKAADALSELDRDETSSTRPGAAATAASTAGLARSPELTQRLLDLNRGASPAERLLLSAAEKAKGNEHFRANEYAEAVERYTLALGLRGTAGEASLFANRAASYIKLKMWDAAEQDASAALEATPAGDTSVLKPYIRRAMARLEMGRPAEALVDCDAALKLQPGCAEAVSLRDRAVKVLGDGGMRRMVIEEEDEDEEEEGEGEVKAAEPSQQQEAVESTAQKAVANGPSQPQQLPVAPAEVPGATRRRLVVVEESDSDNDEEKEQQQQQPRDRQASATGNHGAAMSSAAAAAAAAGVAGGVVATVVPVEEPAAPPSPPSRASAPVVEKEPNTAAAEPIPAPPLTAASAAAEEAVTIDLPMPPAPTTTAQPPPQPLPQQTPVAVTASPAPPPPACVPPPPPKPQPPEPTPDLVFTAAVTAVKDAGNAAFKSGNYREAERRYTEALELAPDWAALYINRCMARTHLGDGHGALRDAADATALDPDNVKALHKRARAKALLRLWQMSCEDLRLCLELMGPQDRSRADVTRELTAMEGKVAEAEARRAAREAAAAARPQRITQYARARVTIEEHDEPEAESADEAPLLAPEEAELQEATALSRLAKLRQVAEERRQHWLAKADHSAAAEYRTLLRDWEEATAAAAALPAKKASESSAPLASSGTAVPQPDPQPQPQAAQVPQAAHPAQVRAQQAPPPSPQKPGDIAAQVEAIKNEGNEHFRAKRFMEAESCYLRCLDLDPSSIPVHLNLLATMNETRRYGAVEQQAEKVLQLLAVSGTALTSEQATNMRSKVFHRRATARRALGRLAEAQEDLRAARALLGQSPVLDGELESLGREMAAEREAIEAAAAASAVVGGAAVGGKEQGGEQRGSKVEEEAAAPVVVATATAPEAAPGGALRRQEEGAIKSADLSTASASSVAQSASRSKGAAAVVEPGEQRRGVSRVAPAPAGSTVESTVAAAGSSHAAAVTTPLTAPATATAAATSNGGSGSSSSDGRAPPAPPTRRKMVVVEVDDESDEEDEEKKVEARPAAAPAESAAPAEARGGGVEAATSTKECTTSTTSSSSSSTTTAPAPAPASASSSELPPPPAATATDHTTTPSTATPPNTTTSACAAAGDVAEATRLREEGNRLFGVGNYARAGQLYDASIAVCAHNPAAYCNRSLVRLYLKRPAEALKDAELAIEQAPADYPKARLRKAMALGDLGRPSEALEVLQPLLDANPGDPQLMEYLEKWKAAVEETKGSSAKVVALGGKQQQVAATTAASAARVPAGSQPPVQPTAAATITVANANGNMNKAPSANGSGPSVKPAIGQQAAAAAPGTANDRTSSSPSSSSSSLPSTPQPPAPPSVEHINNHTSSPPSPPAVPPPTAPTVARSSSSSLHETACAKAAAALASKAPKKPKPPKNAHELEQALKSLSGHTDVLHEYVRSLDPTTYASVIKANLSTKMITAFVETARGVLGLGTSAGAAANGAAAKQPGVADGAAVEYAVRSLEGLTMVPRFDMTFGLCGKGLKEEVRAIADVLAASGRDVSLLQKSYKL